MELMLRARVLAVIKRPVPATSRVVWGAAVPIPTFEEEPMKRVGVAAAGTEGKTRAATPASNTMFPVVWRRI